MKVLPIAILALILFTGLASAQDWSRVDYGDYLRWVGVHDTPDDAWDVVVSENNAFVADLNAGLVVVDVTDLENPQEIVVMNTPGGARDLALVGEYLLIADQSAGLAVVNISDPVNPTYDYRVPIPSSYLTVGVTVSGDYAYVAAGGVHVVDISNLSSAMRVASRPIAEPVVDIAIVGDRAFATYLDNGNPALGNGLRVLDISNPLAPVWTANLVLPAPARGIAVSGDHAFVALDDLGIGVVDISNPDDPRLEVVFTDVGDPFRIAVSRNRAYVADQTNGMYIVDISDPGALAILGSIDSSGRGQGVYVRRGPQGDDEHAFVAMGSAGLQIVDVSNPIMVGTVGELDTDQFASGLDLVGDFAYLADQDGGFLVIDVSDPTNPTPRGSVNTGISFKVKVVGDLAYVTDFDNGLFVVDVSDPGSPEIRGIAGMTNGARGLALAENFAYVGGAEDGLQVVDISDPMNPQIVDTVDTPGTSVGVALRNPYVFVGDQVGGLRIFNVGDVANPQNPIVVGSLELPGVSRFLALEGDYAYVGDEQGLAVVDVSDPAVPLLAAYLDTPGLAVSVKLDGTYAYVGDHDAGIAVVDVSDPLQPRLVGNVDTPGSAIEPVLSGDLVFVADGVRGLRVLPKQVLPVQQVTIDVKPGSAENPINCKGNPGVIPVAILTTADFDALTVDHTTVRFGPGEAAEAHVFKGPTPRGDGASSSRPVPGAPRRHEADVDHDGDLDLVFHFARAETGIRCGDTEAVLTGQTFDGQAIVGTDAIRTVPDDGDLPDPDGELQISPNPFNPSTKVSFVIRDPQNVRIGVYDVRGRLVAELANEVYPAGRHAVEWQGRDTAGRSVPSGMYFFRVDLGGQVAVRKALLMK